MKKHNFYVYIITIIAAVTGLLFGYDTGVISGAILFINHHFALSPLQTGVVVSSVLLGACLGAMLSGRMADHFGRRKILILTSIIFIIGSLATAASSNIPELIFGRIILGIAIGIGSYTAPLYISEIAPYEIRGALVSFNQLAITLGILSSYLVDYYYAQTNNWRMMLAMGAVPGALLLLGMIILPSSPRWLCLHKRTHQAILTLQRIRGTANVKNEIDAIRANTQQPRAGLKHLLAKHIRAALLIGVGITLVQQLTGINTIIYFAPSILKLAGFNTNAGAILATMGVGVINVVFTVISIPLIDRIGRRPLLLYGLAGMLMSLILLGLAFHSHSSNEILKWTALISMLTFIASYAISVGPVPFVIISEIFPLEIRGLGMGITLASNWAANLLVSLTFLSLVQLIGAADTFFLFATMCVAAMGFVHHYIPETMDCSLEHISANLKAGKHTRHLGLEQ